MNFIWLKSLDFEVHRLYYTLSVLPVTQTITVIDLRHCSKLVHKAVAVTCNSTRISRAINTQRTKSKQKEMEEKYLPPTQSLITRK
jgi:hypothetical protein